MEYMDHSCSVLFTALHPSPTGVRRTHQSLMQTAGFFLFLLHRLEDTVLLHGTMVKALFTIRLPKKRNISLWQRLDHKVLQLTWLQTTPATPPHFTEKQYTLNRGSFWGIGSGPPHTTPPSQPPQEQKSHCSVWNYSNKPICLTQPTLPPHTKWNDSHHASSWICSVASHEGSD